MMEDVGRHRVGRQSTPEVKNGEEGKTATNKQKKWSDDDYEINRVKVSCCCSPPVAMMRIADDSYVADDIPAQESEGSN